MSAARAPHADLVHRLAQSLGFALVGIAPAQPTAHAEHVRQWLAEGKHGDMDYLADPEKLPQMLDPCAIVPGARTIICVADVYGSGPVTEWPSGQGKDAEPDRSLTVAAREDSAHSAARPLDHSATLFSGRIARYAWGDDYHWVIKKRLHRLADELRGAWPEHVFRTTVDTAPVLEREHAGRAGIGWVGKHTLLLHPQLGSYFFLGEIITTLPLQTAADAGTTITDHCGTCTRCLDACPTQAIKPYEVDATRCVSYLTIEHKGLIDPALHAGMGDWLAGCDVCQEVCPFNSGTSSDFRALMDDRRVAGDEPTPQPKIENRKSEIRPAYQTRPPAPKLSLLEVLNWDEDARRKAVFKSALKRIKLEQFKRNALIVAGNWLRTHDNPPLRARIEQLAHDPHEPALVRATARQVLQIV